MLVLAKKMGYCIEKLVIILARAFKFTETDTASNLKKEEKDDNTIRDYVLTYYSMHYYLCIV